MAHLPYIQNENASPEVKVLFESCERMLGRVANAIRVAAHSPKIAQALVGLLVPTGGGVWVLKPRLTADVTVR